jgi:nicotinamide-nucleotide amidase
VTTDSGVIDVPAVIAVLAARGQTVAVAESLTGGLVTARLVDVPGASAVVRGGIVAYATSLKASLLGVDPEILDRVGAVDPEVARQMALGVRERLGATWGLATTGVAGPDAQDGHPPGTAYVAVAAEPTDCVVRALVLPGDRSQVRAATVDAVLALFAQALGLRPERIAGGPGQDTSRQ